jgi:hypothetical protein
MQAKDHARTTRRITTLIITSLALGGCLSDEESAGLSGSNLDSAPTNSAPVISGNPTTAVNVGNPYSFVPTAWDADGDALTFSIENKPAWASFSSGTGKLSGQPTLGDVGVYQNIRISVSDGTDSASLQSVAISVDQTGSLSTTLSWTAPTENASGSPLTDLAGYKLYWGTGSGVYTNSVTINNPSISTYVVDNLAPGRYEFVATSFNSAGEESAYSNPAWKEIQ